MSVFALLERLLPRVEREVNLVINAKEEVETLSSKLKKIQEGLQDAEKKGVTDDSIKNWLKELEDVTYEMDDVLDEWETTNIQLRLEVSQDFSDPWEKVRSLFLSLCFCFKHVVGRREIVLKMKGLSERLDKIVSEKGKYNFVPSESDHAQEFRQSKSTSVVDKLKVYGRDDDKDSLLKKLVSEGEESSKGAQIISIVGMGGAGKTTLAQLVYNDPDLEGKFDLKAWVSVSEPFDAFVVARAILEGFGKSSPYIHELETLVQHLRESVENKRFLIVLDNVLTYGGTEWDCLKDCLHVHGAPGSRILLTTWNDFVAQKMGTSQWQRLGLLSDLYCGAILNGIALDGRTKDEYERLRDIGMGIAQKCNGLPLAARTVGSMLASRIMEEEWRDVLESPLWKRKNEASDLFRPLKLSFIDLHPLLKRCFLSCIVFSKGSLITVDKLIRIWMAYGFLSSSSDVRELRLKGGQYLRELTMRSFFQKLEDDEYGGGIIPYKMHDIMLDFAKYLSGSEYSFVMDGDEERGKNLPFQRAHYNMPLNSYERIRTFCVRNISPEELPLHLITHLKRVRLMIISGCDLLQLPEDVGKLIHLRYLDLSNNPIQELPKTMSDLYNLRTLDLESCSSLSRLPEGIAELINLRHLLNRNTPNLKQYPQGLEKLTSLTLSEFRVRGASELAYLRKLNKLQGSLCIFLRGLNDTTNGLEEVGKEILKNKDQLERLELCFHNEELSDDMVDALEPPPNLPILVTHSSSSKWLSHWMRSSFDCLKVLEFDGYGICSDLPPFGKLPALEQLEIFFCDFKSLGTEFLGNEGAVVDAKAKSKGVTWFPKLKKLYFGLCKSWKEWKDIDEEAQDLVPIMPRLEELIIVYCDNLSSLPHTFLRQATSLQSFQFIACGCLEDRYYKGLGPDWDKISHIPRVESKIGAMRSTIAKINNLEAIIKSHFMD